MRRHYRTLLEAVQHPGVENLTTNNTYDLYRIDTFDGAQQFTAHGRPAGGVYAASEAVFNANITNTPRILYFVTQADAAAVLYAFLRPNFQTPASEMSIETAQGHQHTATFADLPQDLYAFLRGYFTQLPETPPGAEEGPEEPQPEVELPQEEPQQEEPQAVEPPQAAPEENPEEPGHDPMDDAAELAALDDSEEAPQQAAAATTDNAAPNARWIRDDEGNFVLKDADENILARRALNDDAQWSTPKIRYKKFKDHIKITSVRCGYYKGSWRAPLQIPDTIEGLPVTEIAPYAFIEPGRINIELPSSIKKIPPHTFVSSTAGLSSKGSTPSRIVIGPDTKTFKYSVETLDGSKGSDPFVRRSE